MSPISNENRIFKNYLPNIVAYSAPCKLFLNSERDGDNPKYLYLHENDYLHFYWEDSGPNAAIWIERKVDTKCPMDNPPPFGYYS